MIVPHLGFIFTKKINTKTVAFFISTIIQVSYVFTFTVASSYL